MTSYSHCILLVLQIFTSVLFKNKNIIFLAMKNFLKNLYNPEKIIKIIMKLNVVKNFYN